MIRNAAHGPDEQLKTLLVTAMDALRPFTSAPPVAAVPVMWSVNAVNVHHDVDHVLPLTSSALSRPTSTKSSWNIAPQHCDDATPHDVEETMNFEAFLRMRETPDPAATVPTPMYPDGVDGGDTRDSLTNTFDPFARVTALVNQRRAVAVSCQQLSPSASRRMK